MWLSPWHGCPWEIDQWNGQYQQGVCTDKLLYVHVFCTAGGVKHKTEMAKKLGLWFIDEQLASATQPVLHHQFYITHTDNFKPGKSASELPCPHHQEVAWQDSLPL
jgi:hypothetical protein